MTAKPKGKPTPVMMMKLAAINRITARQFYAMRSATLDALERRGLITAEPMFGTVRWTLTDAGREALTQ